MSEIAFTIPGEPVGKGRPKFTTIGGFGRAYTPAKTRKYEELVRLCYLSQCKGQDKFSDDTPINVEVNAYFKRPKSGHKNDVYVLKKPDCDNILKICLDSLNGLAFRDDSQVAIANCVKMWTDAEPFVTVKLRECCLR